MPKARSHAKLMCMSTKPANQSQCARGKPGSAGTVRVPESPSDMVTVPELAARLRISPTTAYRWVRLGKLIAWERGGVLQGPVEQVLGPRIPLPGLHLVAEAMNLPPELVWDFLANPWPWSGSPPEPPARKLKKGEIEDVLNAAPAYLTSMG